MFSLISGLTAPINRAVLPGQIPSKAMPKPPPTKPTFSRRSAARDRPHRRGDARAPDRARRDHRPPDRGEEDPGIRLRVPPGARGRHDAPAGRAPSRQPAARHRRKHLAGHHLDLHLCAGALFRACRPVRRRRADARFRALPFRLHRAVRAAYGRGERRRGGHGVERRSRPRPRLRHRRRRPVVDRARIRQRAEDHRAAAVRRTRRSSRRPCRCSWSRASPPTPW